MTTATATRISYRQTKAGAWVAFGPVADVVAGATVTITKKDGSTKQFAVESVGRSFEVDGQDMVYGYGQSVDSSAVAPAPAPARAPKASAGRCAGCGGALSTSDLARSSIRGYHFDCA